MRNSVAIEPAQNNDMFWTADIASTHAFNQASLGHPADLPDALKAQVNRGSNRAVSSQNDVVMLIKKYICSPELSQAPLLTLTQARFERLRGPVPVAKKRLRTNRTESHHNWLKLAEPVLASYGDKYAPAAAYLRALADDKFWKEAELPAMDWPPTIVILASRSLL